MLNNPLQPLTFMLKLATRAFSVALALLIFGYYVLFTSHGTRMAVKIISDYTPYQIQYSSLKGSLANEIEFSDFYLYHEDVEVAAQSLTLQWQLKQLFRAHKTIHAVRATKLNLLAKNASIDPSTTTASLESLQEDIQQRLPFPIRVNHIDIVDATLFTKDNQHHVKHLNIERASSKLSEVKHLEYQGEWGTLSLAQNKGLQANWDLHIQKVHWLKPYIGQFLHSKGKVILPTHRAHDPNTVVDVEFEAQKAAFGKHRLLFPKGTIKGKAGAHRMILTTTYQDFPLNAVIDGKWGHHAWKGKITSFKTSDPHWKKMGKATGLIAVHWPKDSTKLALQLNFSRQAPIHLNASISKLKPHLLSGEIQTEVGDLKSLSMLVPDLTNVRGKLNINLKLAGTISEPDLLGVAHLSEARVKTVSKGTNAHIDNMEIHFLSDNKVNIVGKGTWGEGNFTLNGFGSLLTPSPTLELRLQGENLLVSDTPEYHIVANPDLVFTFKDNIPTLNGRIFVPNAFIQSLTNPDRMLPSKDVVVIHDSQHTPAPLPKRKGANQVRANIELILGDKVTFHGYGVKTKVGGKLNIIQTPDQPPRAQGKLVFDKGTYKAYGNKRFDIAYGQVLFTGGPISNPILDIQVQRKIRHLTAFSSMKQHQTVTAGIKFSGTLNEPNLAFYSKPAMPDNDIISYLIVGRPQNEISQAQSEILFEGVSQLASIMGKSREDVSFDLAETLKLDQLGLSKKSGKLSESSNPLEDTVLVLGKQLSEKLYLHYSIGLLDTASQFGLRYSLSKNVMIEAATGTQASSADVILSFEGH